MESLVIECRGDSVLCDGPILSERLFDGDGGVPEVPGVEDFGLFVFFKCVVETNYLVNVCGADFVSLVPNVLPHLRELLGCVHKLNFAATVFEFVVVQ